MIKKRFKIEAHSMGYTCNFAVEIDETKNIIDCYYSTSNDTSYVFDDVNGIRHIFSREHSLIEIYPLVAEITYKDGVQK